MTLSKINYQNNLTCSFLYLLLTIVFSLSSCSQVSSIEIELEESCLSQLNLSYFKGAYPGIYSKELYKILGKPDERFEVNEGEEDEGIDLAYYSKDGRILLHWGGENYDEIGMIEYRPKARMLLEDIIKISIPITTKAVHFNCEGKRKITVVLEKDLKSVKEIEWWYN